MRLPAPRCTYRTGKEAGAHGGGARQPARPIPCSSCCVLGFIGRPPINHACVLLLRTGIKGACLCLRCPTTTSNHCMRALGDSTALPIARRQRPMACNGRLCDCMLPGCMPTAQALLPLDLCFPPLHILTQHLQKPVAVKVDATAAMLSTHACRTTKTKGFWFRCRSAHTTCSERFLVLSGCVCEQCRRPSVDGRKVSGTSHE
jgi:hypothetical protein